MLKNQPKWKNDYGPTQPGLGLKRSNIDSVEGGDEGVGGSERPQERKAKQKANNTIMELVTIHFKDYSIGNNETKQVSKGLVTLVGDKVAVAKEAICIMDDHEKIKVEETMMKVDATKTEAKLKLRK